MGLSGCGLSNSHSKPRHRHEYSLKNKPRLNIHPINEFVTAKNGIAIRVNDVNYSNGDVVDTPEQGFKYIIVNVTLKNKNSTSIYYSATNFKITTNEHALSPIATTLAGAPDIQSGTLEPDESVTGRLVFEIPLASKKSLLSYEGQEHSLLYFEIK